MWSPPPLTTTAQAARDAAEADRASHPERYSLDPDRIAALAARRPDDSNWYSPGWRVGLEQFLASASEESRLGAFGTSALLGSAVGRLRAGAGVARFRAEHPHRAKVTLQPPIVVTGTWRAGTTYLFRLLAADGRLRAPLPAELATPALVAGLAPDDREAFVDSTESIHQHTYALNPTLRRIHEVGARLPEECMVGIGTDMRNWSFPLMFRLDGYAGWLAGQDLDGTYERYRQLLEIHERGDGRRWVLKAPIHTAELGAMVAAFPGAVVVHLHRDIVEAVTSSASLFATYRSTYSDQVDPVEVGRFQVDQTELWLRRALAFRSDPGARSATFVDVRYQDLVTDPANTLRSVYAAADLDPPTNLAAFVAAYHASHPRHEHGVHSHGVGDFGLVGPEVRERFAFLADWPGPDVGHPG